MKPFAATNASRKRMQADGWTVEVVERTIPRCWIKKDFLGFADLIALSPQRGTIAIQATAGASRSNANARIAKIKSEPRAAIWLACGHRIQVHSWQGKGSKRECHITELQSLA